MILNAVAAAASRVLLVVQNTLHMHSATFIGMDFADLDDTTFEHKCVWDAIH